MARFRARFGHLFLRGGLWGNRQIVPANWVTRGTTAYTIGLADDYSPHRGSGFLWWTTDYGYAASGHGGHVIAVIPSRDLVVVHRVANGPPAGMHRLSEEERRAVVAKLEVEMVQVEMVPYARVDAMIRMVIAAAPAKPR